MLVAAAPASRRDRQCHPVYRRRSPVRWRRDPRADHFGRLASAGQDDEAARERLGIVRVGSDYQVGGFASVAAPAWSAAAFSAAAFRAAPRSNSVATLCAARSSRTRLASISAANFAAARSHFAASGSSTASTSAHTSDWQADYGCFDIRIGAPANSRQALLPPYALT